MHNTSRNELLVEIDITASEMLNVFSKLGDDKINVVPYEGSWTAAQLLRHVTKSTIGIAKVMQLPAKPAERDAGERIEELKKVFLDFELKMQSPDFIVPEERSYNRQSSIRELQDCFGQLKLNTHNTDLSGLVEGLPLGDITKLEMLYFVLFHTKRHLHQLEKIYRTLNLINTGTA